MENLSCPSSTRGSNITGIDLVIFDCDGVLIDSERLAVAVDLQVLASMGWHLSEAEVIERFVGRSAAHFTAELARYLGRELAADWDEPFNHLYVEAFETALERVPGIDGVLDAVERAGVPMCVASSSGHDKLRFTLGRVELYDRFGGHIFSTDDVERGKPAPDLFIHAAESMGCEPGSCAVVEDSAAGVEAAVAAGMQVFAFAGGVTPRHRLARPGVTVFDTMADLPALLFGESA